MDDRSRGDNEDAVHKREEPVGKEPTTDGDEAGADRPEADQESEESFPASDAPSW